MSIETLSTKDNSCYPLWSWQLGKSSFFSRQPWNDFVYQPVEEAMLGKISLNKSIEATKLHPRTEAPVVGPEVTIPFGALVESAGASRDREKFRYLGELYSVAQDTFLEATRSDEMAPAAELAALLSSETVQSPTACAKGAKLTIEKLDTGSYTVARAKVPGGWLVVCGTGIAFYSDPGHEWDGTSVE
jgi:hypothetical protein